MIKILILIFFKLKVLFKFRYKFKLFYILKALDRCLIVEKINNVN